MSNRATIEIDPSVEMVLKEYQRERLYGTIEVKYESGRVVLIRRIESIKPASLRDNRDEGNVSHE
jgi:hypothetical protein